MAFQQQQHQRPLPQRHVSIPQSEPQQQIQSPTRKRALEESEEWILFSPHAADSASHTATSQTPRTATQLSDFGSLETHHRSHPRTDAHEVDLTYQPSELDDENAELDSLDDGLHAFQHNPFSSTSLHQLDQSGGTVLPTHDGLGTFSAPGAQQQLWQFEKHNPHRRRSHQRRSSLQRRMDQVEEELDVDVEDERTAWIEKWRLEQSRAVLEEIERETRRQRRRLHRLNSLGRSVDQRSTSMSDSTSNLRDSILHENKTPASTAKSTGAESNESWWTRITRKVIQDLIGLDEDTLSVLLGEHLPDQSPTPTQSSPIAAAAAGKESRVTFNDGNYGWELRLLERIARELGVLVHQLSHENTGAFSTYANTDTSQSDLVVPNRDHPPRQLSLRQQRLRLNTRHQPTGSDINFSPTLAPGPLTPPTEADTSLWGIEEEPETSPNVPQRNDEEFWEQDMDLQTIFAYLRRRFTRPSPQPNRTEPAGPLPAAWATDRNASTASALGTSPESLARAESIRRQHPLVHRAAERAAAQNRRRESLLRRHQMNALMQRARGSSCASHSTKRSRRTLSGSSSRHYWDLGGGAGSRESETAFSAAGAGVWGEV